MEIEIIAHPELFVNVFCKIEIIIRLIPLHIPISVYIIDRGYHPKSDVIRKNRMILSVTTVEERLIVAFQEKK